MSLPVAHSLVGGAIYALMAPRLSFKRPLTPWLLVVGLTAAPDLDFIPVWFFGQPKPLWHRTFSHSLTFSIVIGLLIWWALRLRSPSTERSAAGPTAVFCGLLLLSHALVDLLGHGMVGPGYGVKLWWPWLDTFIALPEDWQVLPPGRRHSVGALLYTAGEELVKVGPLAGAVIWWRRRAMLLKTPDPRRS